MDSSTQNHAESFRAGSAVGEAGGKAGSKAGGNGNFEGKQPFRNSFADMQTRQETLMLRMFREKLGQYVKIMFFNAFNMFFELFEQNDGESFSEIMQKHGFYTQYALVSTKCSHVVLSESLQEDKSLLSE